MRLRHKSDYEEFDDPTDEQAQDAISFAEEFFEMARCYCEGHMENKKEK